MTRLTPEEAPELYELLRAYNVFREREAFEPDAGAQRAVRGLARVGGRTAVENLVAQAHGLLEEAGGDEDRVRERTWFALPSGVTRSAWLAYLQRWAPAFAADPLGDDPDDPLDGLRLRAARFDDQQTANEATTAVLRVYEDRVRAWAADPSETPRLYLHSEVGREIGGYVERTADGPTRRRATAAVVIMDVAFPEERPYVAASYPEASLDPRVHDRYPALPLLFGGYFGQDWDALDGSLWSAEWAYNTATSAELRRSAAGQLELLLAQDDAGLLATVDALGTGVLPAHLRRWVKALHRRMTSLGWTPPLKEIPPEFRWAQATLLGPPKDARDE
jgi:hypothetical protein